MCIKRKVEKQYIERKRARNKRREEIRKQEGWKDKARGSQVVFALSSGVF